MSACRYGIRPLCIYMEDCISCISLTLNEQKEQIATLEAEAKALREKVRNTQLREINRDLAAKQQLPQVISVWQMGYLQPSYEITNSACYSCASNPQNGGSGICHCTLGAPKITYTAM